MTGVLKRIDLEGFTATELPLPVSPAWVYFSQASPPALQVAPVGAQRRELCLKRTATGWAVHNPFPLGRTRLNDAPVERAELTQGDVLDIGGALFVFQTRPAAVSSELEAAVTRAPADPRTIGVWADWLLEQGDPVGAALAHGETAARCLEGTKRAVDTGWLELDWRHGLVVGATLRCAPSAAEQVTLLAQVLALRLARWLERLTVDVCVRDQRPSPRCLADASLLLRGLLGGFTLPCLRSISLGYVDRSLGDSPFLTALEGRVRARYPGLGAEPLLRQGATAALRPSRIPPALEFRADFAEGPQGLPLTEGLWVGSLEPARLRASSSAQARHGAATSFAIQTEPLAYVLAQPHPSLLLNGRPAHATRLLPGDVLDTPEGAQFSFVVG